MKTKLLLLLLLATFSISAQINLVPNGGLNSWAGFTLQDWATENSVSRRTANYEGTFSAELSYISASPKITAQVPLQAGVTYTIKFKYLYADNNYNGSHPISLNISKNGSSSTLSSSTIATNNLWNEKEATFTPDANLSYDLSISTFSFDNAPFTVLIDHVQVYVAGTEQYTKIPDINFENKLISLGIDSGAPDGKVQTSNINTITSLDVSSSNITDLTGIEDFVSLTQLYTMSNKLTTLDLSKNVELTTLRCDSNYSITSLNVSKNTKLINLYCADNKISSLDVSAIPDLMFLYCSSNQLSSLNLSSNTKLQYLYVNGNLLTSLDLSKNTLLNTIQSQQNSRLETLNLQNGQNTLIQKINLNYTPSLYCILVDDIAYSTANWESFKASNVDYSLTCQTPEYIIIPDPEFEKALMTNGLDGVVDGKILKSKVLATDNLHLNIENVTDLTGLESFKNLKNLELTAFANASTITKFNITPFTQLTSFTCRTKSLSEIDVSQNVNLTELNLSNNKLTKLDLSSNLALEKLIVSSNAITDLNVTQNTALKTLGCGENPLTVINVSKNTALESLYCYNTKIKTLDITNNPALQNLDVELNYLKLLDISKNLQLVTLNCDQNDFKSLDISKNTLLTKFSCGYNNDLSYLNLKNGNNKNFITNTLNYRGFRNTKLSCIEVDDVEYSNTNWATLKDASATYSSSCDVVLAYTAIPDPNFEEALILKGIDKDGKNGKVLTSEILNLTSLNVSDSNIKDLTGIQDFVSLTSLDCSKNNLTVLNVSNNTFLTELKCSNNTIFSLDVSYNARLTNLSASFNKIVSLDLSANKSLKEVECASNNLHNLNLKNGNNANMQRMIFGNFTENPHLVCIEVDDATFAEANWIAKDANASYSSQACPLNEQQTLIPDLNFERILIAQGIDKDGENGKVRTLSILTLTDLTLNDANNKVSDLTGIQDFRALTSLNANNNNIKTVDLSSNTALILLNLDNNQLTEINVSNNTSLWGLSLNYNKLTTLDISKNTKLGSLNIQGNQVADLDISKNTSLSSLDGRDNQLTSLEVSKNTILNRLYLGNNSLKTIDLSQNTKLNYLSIYDNLLTSLDVSNNPLLVALQCAQNQIRTLDLSKNNKLTQLYVNDNKIYNLNLKNGANSLINTTYSDFKRNPYLTCIEVDDVAFSNEKWSTLKDVTANFSSATCPNGEPFTLIPDVNFENKLIALGIDKDGPNGKVATYSIDTVTSLNVSKSNITDLTGLQDFTALNSLEAADNKLTTINITNNKLLANLNVSKNQLSSVDVSANYKLATLNCNANKITALNLSNNYLLSNLNCSNNTITTLDVSNQLELTNLNCSTNALTVLNVSRNTKLTVLSASINKLESLDVSKNTILKEIDCASNELYNLNLKNGNNANMERVIFGNFTENPNLLCIQVDDAAFSNDNWIAKDATATYSSEACPVNGKYTLIPDPNFEKILIAKNIDTDGENGKVLTKSLLKVTYLNVSDTNLKVSDLTGIEDCTALETLYCYSAALTNLDVSKNINLQTLDCSNNKLTSLNLSKNSQLKSVDFSRNDLTSIDLSANTNLTRLTGSNNQLSALDLSKNKALETVSVYNNKLTNLNITENLNLTNLTVSKNLLTSIDLSNNASLKAIDIAENQFTTVDISKNPLLVSIFASKNNLESLNLSNNTSLTSLHLQYNKLATLDISTNKVLSTVFLYNNMLTSFDITKNSAINTLNLDSNQLTSLNLKNGKNSLISVVSMRQNSKLNCILVDDVIYANTNWNTSKDEIATYNIECTGELVLAPSNFTVETKGESCLGENNGEISIVGKASFAYNATINDKSYTFTNNALKISALTPGVYKIKITIPEMIFEQNFNVTIQKGATITGKSNISAKNVNVEITEGTAPFTVFVDGTEQFQTTDNNFTVSLDKAGLVEVATAKACEGVFAKKVTSYELGTMLSAYPNPTSGSIEIEIPSSKTEVAIDLYNFGGQLVSHGTYNIESGRALLNLEKLPSGIYAAKINLETPEYIKIIKN
ncbi:T9SS type A sorting domain-containing protein [Flavobacterium nitrogenifigens]|uniref:Por secretion system C-terminal sorting domain-containing protein n=1 Tax=Flavobacterium nitrogenifigens TaxID=1617283 RepID=A0A521CM48_9FLAO|nr:T9SS type A sorting domain-containing protein [Flavobacterium nitrogenifigens]KAF2328453.1 T9SS type A sorting domain-containing protein [Flavobacterium nitrogenifigens]SMO60523.1 Por secretion system C-terminal sorting domain-containing protein [Flavobacterium nitrogenifigens]